MSKVKELLQKSAVVQYYVGRVINRVFYGLELLFVGGLNFPGLDSPLVGISVPPRDVFAAMVEQAWLRSLSSNPSYHCLSNYVYQTKLGKLSFLFIAKFISQLQPSCAVTVQRQSQQGPAAGSPGWHGLQCSSAGLLLSQICRAALPSPSGMWCLS